MKYAMHLTVLASGNEILWNPNKSLDYKALTDHFGGHIYSFQFRSVFHPTMLVMCMYRWKCSLLWIFPVTLNLDPWPWLSNLTYTWIVMRNI